MSIERKHSNKILLVRNHDGTYWEEWLLFNRGKKTTKPVKFIAERTWQSDYSMMICPFAAKRCSYSSEKSAEADLIEEIIKHSGIAEQYDTQLVNELNTRFGYKTTVKYKAS